MVVTSVVVASVAPITQTDILSCLEHWEIAELGYITLVLINMLLLVVFATVDCSSLVSLSSMAL